MSTVMARVPINEAPVTIGISIIEIEGAPPTSPGPHMSRPLDPGSRVTWSATISVVLVRVTNTLKI